MTDDKELIARLRSIHWCVTTKANGVGVSDEAVAPEAADRIEALTAERDQHWDSFVHWRKEADDRSEQLAAARQDAKEAEAYAEELEKERDVASIWNEAVDEALDILDDEGWLGESRERIELLKKPLGGKDVKSNL